MCVYTHSHIDTNLYGSVHICACVWLFVLCLHFALIDHVACPSVRRKEFTSRLLIKPIRGIQSEFGRKKARMHKDTHRNRQTNIKSISMLKHVIFEKRVVEGRNMAEGRDKYIYKERSEINNVRVRGKEMKGNARKC